MDFLSNGKAVLVSLVFLSGLDVPNCRYSAIVFFMLRKHSEKPYIKALEEQRKKVDELLGRVHKILSWKNDGWHYAYRSWAWTGEGKAFARLKEEHAVLMKRLELLKQLET